MLMIVVALLWLYCSKKRNWRDRPGHDQERTKPVPTLQGVFVYIGLIVVLAIVFPSLLTHKETWSFVLGAGCLCVLAVVDEYMSMCAAQKNNSRWLKDVLPGWLRLALQLIIIIAVIRHSWVYDMSIVRNGQDRQIPELLGIVMATIWIVIFINSINRFDGIHGQSSWLSAIGFVTIFILVQRVVLPYYADITADKLVMLSNVKVLSLILAVSAVIYTIVEIKPYGLLRDAGVLIYGFGLGYLSLLGWAKIGTMLVALSLPLFDAMRVLVHRLCVMKKNPMKGDYTHLYYRLFNLGRSKAEARSFTRVWSLTMMVLILIQGVNRTNKIIIFSMMALLFFGINIYLFRYKKYPVEYIKGNKG